ncbi:methyltransferase family protein [Caballeronia sp. M23-90]
MAPSASDYGLWHLVVINSLFFIIFAYSFFKPTRFRDWRTFGGFSAFIIALFAEMYGFPLTVYLLSGWLEPRFPQTNLFSHDAGHIWWMMSGRHGNPHLGIPHVLSFVFILGGFYLLSVSWHVLFSAQRRNELATAGPYQRVRHPQYVAFVLVMFGFLLQWATLLTLVMFGILVMMYVRLALSEEKKSAFQFGQAWQDYATRTHRFVPTVTFTIPAGA